MPLRDVPMVLISANGFLGDLLQQLVRKLPKTAGVPRDRLLVTVNNWTTASFLSYVEYLEARCDRKFVPDLTDCEVVDAGNKWKELEVRRNVTASWCFSTMSVAEEICDLFNTVDVKALRQGPRDKNFSAAYKNIFFLPNGDVVAAIPPVHLTHRKVVFGTVGALVERVDIVFSTVFIANAIGTEPHIPMKIQDGSFDGASRDVWPLLPGYKNVKKYITSRLGKTILKAHDVYENNVRRSDMFRACILEEAAKWAAIPEEEIGVAENPHRMNPRITPNQSGNIIPDAIVNARKAKAKEKMAKAADKKRAMAAVRKKKSDARKCIREKEKALESAIGSSTSNKRMTRGDSARHASWCKKMQGWGSVKKKRRCFY